MPEPNIQSTVDSIRQIVGDFRPQAALILGSGLGGIANEIKSPAVIPFKDIPGFASSTAHGHRGDLVFGELAGKRVVAMAGRFHRYEGWSIQQITYPVRVLAALNASLLIVSNAAGGVRHHFRVGEIMVIRDHLNFIPLPFPGGAFLGRGQSPYDTALIEQTLAIGREFDFAVHPGTYLATLGPSYETRAEYRMMRRLGADAVGMSTVPEVLVAQQCGLRVLALSMISNLATPDAPQETTHQEVLDAGLLAAPRMSKIVNGVLGGAGE